MYLIINFFASSFYFEILRWIGVMIIRNAVRRKENAEQNEQNPHWIDKQLAKLVTSVGRIDRIKD